MPLRLRNVEKSPIYAAHAGPVAFDEAMTARPMGRRLDWHYETSPMRLETQSFRLIS